MKTQEILDGKTISFKNVKLLIRRMNHGEEIDLQDVWDNPKRLEDTKQGIDYLLNQWKTPNGKERLNNPFGYREQEVLENFEYFEFAGTYNAGNYGHTFHVPLWNVIGRDGSFQYYMSGGEINIVG